MEHCVSLGQKRHYEDGNGVASCKKSARAHNSDLVLCNFLQWMKDESFCIPPKLKATKKDDCSRYCLFAEDHVESDEILFTIPRSSLLWEGTCSVSALLADSADELQSPSGWVKLVLSLMHEYTNKSSKWRPYLDFLPSVKELDQPMFWSQSDLSLLKGTTCADAVKEDIERIEEEYNNIALPFIKKHTKHGFNEELHSIHLYKHMMACIMAYSFTEPHQDGDDDDDSDEEDEETQRSSTIMVPMADFLNHISKNNAHLEFDEDHLKMVATKAIQPGSQIYNTYGQLANSELLQMYGFVEERGANVYDQVVIPIDVVCDNILLCKDKFADAEGKVEFIKEEVPVDDFNLVIGVDGILSERDFGLIQKILCLSKDQFLDVTTGKIELVESLGAESESDDEGESQEQSYLSKLFSFGKMPRILGDSMKTLMRKIAEQMIRNYDCDSLNISVETGDSTEDSTNDSVSWRTSRTANLIRGQIDILLKLKESCRRDIVLFG